MFSINTVTISGRLFGDPKIRILESGLKIGDFTIAGYDPSQKKKENPEPLRVKVTVFGKVAEDAEELSKGKLVTVTGSLNAPRAWETKNGETVLECSITADAVVFDRPPKATTQPQAQPQTQPVQEVAEPDSDNW